MTNCNIAKGIKVSPFVKVLVGFFILLALCGCIFGTIVILLSIKGGETLENRFDFSTLASIIGIFFSIIFVILAIDAYSNIREISNSKEEIRQLLSRVKAIEKENEYSLLQFSQEQINIAIACRDTQLISELYLRRGRFLYSCSNLTPEERKRLAYLLASYGKQEDIKSVIQCYAKETDSGVQFALENVINQLVMKYNTD